MNSREGDDSHKQTQHGTNDQHWRPTGRKRLQVVREVALACLLICDKLHKGTTVARLVLSFKTNYVIGQRNICDVIGGQIKKTQYKPLTS